MRHPLIAAQLLRQARAAAGAEADGRMRRAAPPDRSIRENHETKDT